MHLFLFRYRPDILTSSNKFGARGREWALRLDCAGRLAACRSCRGRSLLSRRLNFSQDSGIGISISITTSTTPPSTAAEATISKMDSPADSQQQPAQPAQAQRPRRKESSLKALYLILYNSISALLWSVVLGRTVLIGGIHGWESVFLGTGEFVKWTQTLAGLEVLHAATGIVRAPLLTTLMQVASRFLLVWGIVEQFPATTGFGSPAYSSMLVAWSVTEVIRYSFFAVNLSTGRVPGWLMWLRYNTFFVLYPLGIGSECWLVWRAMEPARSWNLAYEYALRAVLFVYIPGEFSRRIPFIDERAFC